MLLKKPSSLLFNILLFTSGSSTISMIQHRHGRATSASDQQLMHILIFCDLRKSYQRGPGMATSNQSDPEPASGLGRVDSGQAISTGERSISTRCFHRVVDGMDFAFPSFLY